MKNEKLYAAIGAADDELLIRCEAEVKKPKFTWVKFGSLAACAAAVLIFCIWAIPGLISTQNNPIENTPNNPSMNASYNPTENTPNDPAVNSSHNPTESIPFDPNNTAIVGLPALDFSLADLHNSSGIEEDRMIRLRTTDFFSNGAPDTIVFVRVLDIEEWTYKDMDAVYTSERQTSNVQVISTVWSGVEVPEAISVMQWKYGGCCLDEETNLLRVGGVYMLPLRYWEGDDVWIIDGELDVLFEVDDQGRIWSHSAFEEFRRYDGKDWSVLVDSINVITSDVDFPAAITLFGRIANDWGRLTEVTIMSVTHSVSEYGYDQIEYGMRVNDVLSVAGTTWSSWQPGTGDEIIVISHDSTAYLEQGGRYLMHLDPSEGGPFIEAARVARVNADGTITAIPLSNQDNWQRSVFSEFDGYTVAQMQEQAQRAKAWHERFAN